MKSMLFRLGGIAVGLLVVTSQGAFSQDYMPPSSNPEHLYAFKDYVYCSADDGVHGRELWRVNLAGDKALVKDITLGSQGSVIRDFGAMGEVLYFRVDDPEFGGELWRTDGTEAGTRRVKRFDFGPGFGFVCVRGELRGRLLLTVFDGENRLWSTDGTEAGTRPYMEEGVGFQFVAGIDEICSPNGFQMYFSTQFEPGRFGVFLSDGTAAGTVMLCQTEKTATSFFAIDNTRVLFQAEFKATGTEPWITDGTPENTRMLLEINPGEAGGIGSPYYKIESDADKRIAIFTGSSPDKPDELWTTDGTPEGTRPFLETQPGKGTALTNRMESNQQFLYFIGRDTEYGSEIWMAAPFKNELVRMSDANPGVADADPYALRTMENTNLVFSASNTEFGEELWVTGYGLRPAYMLEDIYPGPGSSLPYYTTELNGRIVFAATDPVHGRELWMSNGKDITRPLADIYSDASINPSSSPGQLTAVGDLLYFVANDIAHGSEPWRTDGTPGGTRMLKDILPGRASSNVRELTAADGWLYFAAEDGVDGVRLWRSDGAESGTVIADRIGANPEHLTAFKGGLLYAANDERNGRELRRILHDNISGRVCDIATGALSSNPHQFVVAGPYVYFLADDHVHGEELWRTDGTEEGTAMVRDIVEVPYEPLKIGEYTGTSERLYFSAATSSLGDELWVFDTARRSVSLVQDIARVDSLLLLKTQSGGVGDKRISPRVAEKKK